MVGPGWTGFRGGNIFLRHIVVLSSAVNIRSLEATVRALVFADLSPPFSQSGSKPGHVLSGPGLLQNWHQRYSLSIDISAVRCGTLDFRSNMIVLLLWCMFRSRSVACHPKL
jgi:hypothetical protein